MNNSCRSRRTGVASFLKAFLLLTVFQGAVLIAETNVLVLGSSKSFSEDYYAGEASVSNQQPFNAQLVADELKDIISGTIPGQANVVFEDIYRSTTRYINGGASDPSKGYSLQAYFYHPTDREARWNNLKGENGTQWDYIILMEDPSILANTPGVYANGVRLILNKIKEGSSPAQLILMMQWPESGSVDHFGEVVYRVGDSGDIPVAPAGYAWTDYSSKDSGSHPTPDGAYLSAATLYSTMYNESARASSYTYNNSLADHAWATVQAHATQSHYSGVYDTPNPYLILGEKDRTIRSKQTGSSTEAGLLDYVNYSGGRYFQALLSSELHIDNYGDDPDDFSGKTHFHLGRALHQSAKRYKNEPGTYRYAMGFPYQIRNLSAGSDSDILEGQWDMLYGMDVLDNDYGWEYDRGDQRMSFLMIKNNQVANGIRILPTHAIWAAVNKEMGLTTPYTDTRHFGADMNEAMVSYMMTLLTGRCAIGKNGTATERERQRIGYEHAWVMSTLNVRTPGFTTFPSATSAKSIAAGGNEDMSVYFINAPQAQVDVAISLSSAAAAIVNPKSLSFDATNHDVIQTVKVVGLPGASASESVNVEFDTASSDVCFNLLSDSWKYEITRSTTEALTIVEQADSQVVAGINGPKVIDLGVAGSEEANTVFASPFHGTLSWSFGDVVYTPNADYVGTDSFAFAVNSNGVLTKGFVEITVQDAEQVLTFAANGSVDVVEGGGSDGYDVSLNKAPVANVTVTLSADSQVSVAPVTLTFTPSNWSTAQSVTVTAIDDSINEHAHVGSVAHTVSSSDPNWSIVEVNPMVVQIQDNDNTAPVVNAGVDKVANWTVEEPPAVTAGYDVYLNAGDDNGENTTWEATAGTWQPTAVGGVTFVADAGSSLIGITSAYDLPGGSSASDGFTGDSLQTVAMDKSSVSIEIWFKPDTVSGHPANGQILYETGGGTGFGIFYNNGSVEVAHDSNAGLLSHDVSALVGEFIQVLVTFEMGSSTDNYKLYINGDLKVTFSRNDSDLSGSDGAGLGTRGGSNAGGRGNGDANTESFDGQIAIFRVYYDQILTEGEVLTNYQSVVGQSGAETTLAGETSDVDNDTLTLSWTMVSGPAAPSIADATSEQTSVSFSALGEYIFRLSAFDGSVEVTDDVTITVASGPVANNAPVAEDLAVVTNEDVAVAANLIASDSDGDSLSYSFTNPANGTLSGTAPDLIYTPNLGFFGSDSFTFFVNDGDLDSNVATVSIIVNEVVSNSAPLVNAGENLTLTLSEGGVWSPADVSTLAWFDASDESTVTKNASDRVSQWNDKSGNDHHVVQGSSSKQPTSGLRSLNHLNVIDFDGTRWMRDSSFPIPPSGNIAVYLVTTIDTVDHANDSVVSIYNTSKAYTDDFQFSAGADTQFNGRVTTTTGTIDMTGGPFSNDQMFGITFDFDLGEITAYANGTDGGSLSGYSTKLGATHNLNIFSNRNPSTNRPPDGAMAEVIIVEDCSAELRQKIEGYLAHKWGLDAKLPADHPYKSAAPGGSLAVANLNATVYDAEGDPLTTTWTAESGPDVVSFADSAETSTSATFSTLGTYVLRLTASDGPSSSYDELTVEVVEEASSTNSAPVANDDSVSTVEDVAVAVALSASDVDDDDLSYSFNQPTNGTLSGTAPVLTYTPDLGFFGSDSFTFIANDGELNSNVATIIITVSERNNVPVASDSFISTDEDVAVAANLVASDPDGDNLNYSVVIQPSSGVLSGVAPSLTYTPNSGFTGSDSFSFFVDDGDLASNVATVSITVNEVILDSAPVVEAGSDQTITLSTGVGGGEPTAGSYFEWDAPQDTAGDSVWPSLTENALDISFGSAQTAVAVADDRFDLLTTAYAFPAAKATAASFQGYGDTEDASFEVVLDLDTDDAVIFETGGGWVGTQIDVNNGSIRFHVHIGQGIAPYTLTVPLTEEDKGRFIHVVGVTDLANDTMSLYLDGALVDSRTDLTANDWAGSGTSGLGRIEGDGASENSPTGVEEGDLTGKIALFRFYRNKALTAEEVAANFSSLSSPSSAIAELVGEVSDADGDPLTTTWTTVSGPAAVALANPSSNNTSATFSTLGSYVLRLTADDGSNVSYDEVRVDVVEETMPNNAPVAVDSSESTEKDQVLNFELQASDDDDDALTYTITTWPLNGTVTLEGSAVTYTPDSGYVGNDSLSYEVSDGKDVSNTATVSLTVVEPVVVTSPPMVSGVVASVDGTWQTVALSQSFTSMVVVATPVYINASVPMVVRIRNASDNGNTFEIKLQNPGDLAAVTPSAVHYTVVEEGVYHEAEHGITMEAVKYISSVTDNKSSWVGEQRTYSNAYTSPIIFGQVMSADDANWSAFWCRGSSRSSSPSPSTLYTGKFVGHDSNKVRADEVIGYLVIEEGSVSVDGKVITAGTGSDTVQGMDDAPSYSYGISTQGSIESVIVNQARMDGGDGGWAVLYETPTSTTLEVAIDEDQIGDSERNHTTEPVSYLIVE